MCKWRTDRKTDREGRLKGEEGRGKRRLNSDKKNNKKTSPSMGDKQFEKLRVWLIRIKLI